MIKRLTIRTLILGVLTIAAFALMQPLTIFTGWPEVMQGTKAAAMLAWAEHSIMIIRITMQPRLDVQDSAINGARSPAASAAIYAIHQFTWAVRLGAFLLLYGVL